MRIIHLISLSLVSVFSYVGAGEYADAYLLASHYPQVQSLGYSTVASEVSSGHAMNNPAGIARLNESHLTLVYDQFGGLSNNVGLEAVIASNNKYQYGVTIVHSMVDDLFSRPNLSGLTPGSRRDSVMSLQGTTGKSINYREEGIFFTLARQFEFEFNLGWKLFKIPCVVPVGVSAKYIDKLLVENRGLGAGFDFGGQLLFNLGEMSDLLLNTEFALGAFYSDILNTPVYWSTKHQDAIKRGLVTGFAMTQSLNKIDSEISFSTSQHSRFNNVNQYGAEIRIKNAIIVRAGHDGFTPSLGLGISLKKFIIDYSFSQHGLTDRQKIGINYHF